MQMITTITNTAAYIDGGSASMFFQALVGGLLAAIVLLPAKLRQISSWVSGLGKKPTHK